MRLTFSVVWKSWVSNPLRTTLTILGVALGVAVVTAIHVLDHNTIQSRLRELRPDFGRVDFELVPADRTRDPDQIRDALQRTPGIDAVGLLHTAPVRARADRGEPLGDGANGAVTDAVLFGVSPLPSRAFSHYAVDEGADLTDLDGDRHALIGRELADSLGIGVGDALFVAAPVIPPRALCKGGVLVVPDGAEQLEQPAAERLIVKGILARTGLARRSFGHVVLGGYPVARRLAPGNHGFYQVNRQYGVDADDLRRRLSSDYQVLDENSALLGEAADERAFRNGVKVLGCLALVLGMFVVFQTLSQSLVERLRQIGLLRCLGASRGTVASIFLLDAVMMAAIGVTLGVGLGLLLALLLQQSGFTTLGVGKSVTTFEVPLAPLLWTAALGLVFTLTGASFPLFKARNLPAVQILNARGLFGERGADVLRGVHVFLFVLLVLFLPGAYLAMTPLLAASERETRAVLMQLGGLIVGFGAILLLSPSIVRAIGKRVVAPWRRNPRNLLPAFLVERSLQHSSGRFSASVCGLAIVLLAIVALGSITAALRAEIDEFGSHTTSGRIFVGGEAITEAGADSLRAIPGVRAVEVHAGRRQVPFLLSGIGPAALQRAGGVFDRHPELASAYRDERSVIVSRRLARLYGLSGGTAGETLGVLTDEGRKPYRVLAVDDDVGFWVEERAFAIAHPHWLQQDFCVGVDSVTAVTLLLEAGADVAAVQDAVRARAPTFTRFRDGDGIVDYHHRDLTRDFVLFDVLLALILALAVMGLVNQMTLAALARVREIGVLRALGTDRAQLRRTFLIESTTVAMLAAGAAILLGIPLGWFVVDGLNRVTGLDAPYAVPWSSLGAVVVIAVVIGALAAILPGFRAARLSPAESVRYE